MKLLFKFEFNEEFEFKFVFSLFIYSINCYFLFFYLLYNYVFSNYIIYGFLLSLLERHFNILFLKSNLLIYPFSSYNIFLH